jgi:TetR/AcrR family transcriptional regulator
MEPPTHKRRGIGRPRAGDASAVGRDALVAAACELLTHLPPAQVTRSRVARAVNVDPSLIRYYFRDRATLLLAAFDRLTEELLQTSAEILPDSAHAPAHQRLRASVKAMLRLNFRYPHFHQLLIEEVASMPDPVAREHMQRMTGRGLAAYDSILEAGANEHSMRRVDRAFLFVAVLGMAHYFIAGRKVVQEAVGGRAYDEQLLEQYADFVCDLLLNGLAGRRD